jgi:hypothetical protein
VGSRAGLDAMEKRKIPSPCEWSASRPGRFTPSGQMAGTLEYKRKSRRTENMSRSHERNYMKSCYNDNNGMKIESWKL